MNNNDLHHHQSKTSYHMLDKLSSKISAIKEDLKEVVKERRRSFSADRHNSTSSLASINSTVTFSLQDDTQSINLQTQKSFKTSGKTI